MSDRLLEIVTVAQFVVLCGILGAVLDFHCGWIRWRDKNDHN